MRTYVLVEGHGEAVAVTNLLSRLSQEVAPRLAHFAAPLRVPGIASDDKVLRYVELVRPKADVAALLVLRDAEDGCPKVDAPALGERLRALQLPFPVAVVLAYREFETLFLPCVAKMAGRPLEGRGGGRPGLRPDAHYDGDFEAKRGVQEWLTTQMAPGRAYKPTVDQLPLTRMVDFRVVRASGLPWFGSLERGLRFLADHVGEACATYPSGRG